MRTPAEQRLIDRYELLRRELANLDRQADRLDAELVDLENHLPNDYQHPGDATPEQT